MNFHDPDRPKLGNGAPAFNTKLLQGVLPSLSLNLHKPGEVRITVFLPVTQTRYRPQHIELAQSALEGFLKDFEHDPEDALLLYFKWSVEDIQAEPAAAGPKPPAVPLGVSDQSADDLGF